VKNSLDLGAREVIYALILDNAHREGMLRRSILSEQSTICTELVVYQKVSI